MGFDIEQAKKLGFNNEESLEIAKKYYEVGVDLEEALKYCKAGFYSDARIRFVLKWRDSGFDGDEFELQSVLIAGFDETTTPENIKLVVEYCKAGFKKYDTIKKAIDAGFGSTSDEIKMVEGWHALREANRWWPDLAYAKKFFDCGLKSESKYAAEYHSLGFYSEQALKALAESRTARRNQDSFGFLYTVRAVVKTHRSPFRPEDVERGLVWYDRARTVGWDLRESLGAFHAGFGVDDMVFAKRYRKAMDAARLVESRGFELKDVYPFFAAGFRTDEEIELAVLYYDRCFDYGYVKGAPKDMGAGARMFYELGWTSAETMESLRALLKLVPWTFIKEIARLKITPDAVYGKLKKLENSSKKKYNKAINDIKVFRNVFKDEYKVSSDSAWKRIWKDIDIRVVNWLEKNGFTQELVESFYTNNEPTKLKNIFIARFFLLPKKSSKSEEDSKSVKIYNKLESLIEAPNDVSFNKSKFDMNVKVFYDLLTLIKNNKKYAKKAPLAKTILKYWTKKDKINKLYDEQKTIKETLLNFLDNLVKSF